MSSVTDNNLTTSPVEVKSNQVNEDTTKPNGQFRSPQDFSLAIEDALKNLQSKIEDMTSTLNGKLGDMETKMQLLEKAINEASPIVGEGGNTVAIPEIDTEDQAV